MKIPSSINCDRKTLETSCTSIQRRLTKRWQWFTPLKTWKLKKQTNKQKKKTLETIKNEICAVRKVFWYIVTIWCLVTNCKMVCILSSLHFCEFLKWVNIPQTVKSTNVWRVELRGGHKTGTAGCLRRGQMGAVGAAGCRKFWSPLLLMCYLLSAIIITSIFFHRQYRNRSWKTI